MSLRSIMRVFVMLAFVVPGSTIVYSQSPVKTVGRPSGANALVEEFSFSIKDFKIDHQGESNVLNISIAYRYAEKIANSEYPDFRSLAHDVETLLTSYPNEDDYWEIVNKQITALLLKKHPVLTSVTCELKVEPSRLVPYPRSSRATRTRPLRRKQ
jgi:serralysin